MILKKLTTDIVITGINMPGMDGLELSKLIKKKYDSDVIVMTGYRSGCNYEKAIDSGASDFFYKPVRLNDLLDSVSKILNKRCTDKA